MEVVQQIEWSGGGLFEKLTFYSIKLGFEQGLNESRPHPEASLLYSGERHCFSNQLDRVEGTPHRHFKSQSSLCLELKEASAQAGSGQRSHFLLFSALAYCPVSMRRSFSAE